jgi:hypothetical protein
MEKSSINISNELEENCKNDPTKNENSHLISDWMQFVDQAPIENSLNHVEISDMLDKSEEN